VNSRLHNTPPAEERVVPDPDFEDCIDACDDCASICLETLTQQCLPAGGPHVEPRHVVLMLDCVDICRTAADFMRRGSPNHARVCAACAESCDACAASCAKLDDMEECVEACRDCAEICREMAGLRTPG
jgi:hypothetical protein